MQVHTVPSSAHIKGVIADGFSLGFSESEIKSMLATIGVRFDLIEKTFKEVGAELGLYHDKDFVAAAIKDKVNKFEWDTITTELDLKGAVISAAMRIKWATVRGVKKEAERFIAEHGKNISKRGRRSPEVRNRVGSIQAAMVDYMNSTSDPTKQGMYHFMKSIGSGPKSAVWNTKKFFNMLYAVKKGITAQDSMGSTITMKISHK